MTNFSSTLQSISSSAKRLFKGKDSSKDSSKLQIVPTNQSMVTLNQAAETKRIETANTASRDK
ncbi:hypothetical protein GGI07_004660, partial [Coemansia sp. Benny D115]